jgi:two-component system response regulator
MAVKSSLSVILVAEDDADDLFLLRRLLNKAGVKNPVVSCGNGDEVVSYLRPVTVNSEKAVRPCLVFLDIKMPKLDGFEVLRWIRKQTTLKTLPVVILSGSDEPRDVTRATELGATRYLMKHPPPELIAELMAAYSTKN